MSGWMITTALVLARISALVFIAPGISHNVVPIRARLLMIWLLLVPVLCVVPSLEDRPWETSVLCSMLVHELVVGVSLALVPAAMVWGLQVAVQALQGMTGLPGGEENPANGDAALQRLFCMTVLLVFFLSSGHRAVIQSLLDSFTWLPAGNYSPLVSTRDVVVDLLSASFELGVRALSPVAVSLAIGLLTLGAINRVIPQVGYFAVGMSVQTAVLFGTLVICIGGVVWSLENDFSATPTAVHLAWRDVLGSVVTP